MSRAEMNRKLVEADIVPAYGIGVTAQSMLQTATGLTVNGPTQTNTLYDGAIFHINVAGATFATGQSLVFNVQARNEYADTFTTIFTGPTITAATSARYVLGIYPLINTADTATTKVAPLGREWRCQFVETTGATTATAMTVSACYNYVGQGRLGGGDM